MSAHGFVCGEFVGVAHFNSELPKVSAFLRTAFLDQLPRRFGALFSASLKLVGSLGKAAQASGSFHLIVFFFSFFSLPVMNSLHVSGKLR